MKISKLPPAYNVLAIKNRAANMISAFPKTADDVSDAFSWTASKEGHQFWSDVHDAKTTAELPTIKIAKTKTIAKLPPIKGIKGIKARASRHPAHDSVNNPAHYTDGKIEVIEFIEDKKFGYNLGNVIKYVSRAGKKGISPLEDLKKACWYLNREIKNLEK